MADPAEHGLGKTGQFRLILITGRQMQHQLHIRVDTETFQLACIRFIQIVCPERWLNLSNFHKTVFQNPYENSLSVIIGLDFILTPNGFKNFIHL